MAVIISNVVFHHASVENEEARAAGTIGPFDYILVNLMDGSTSTPELWSNFTPEEQRSIADAYTAIQKAVGMK